MTARRRLTLAAAALALTGAMAMASPAQARDVWLVAVGNNLGHAGEQALRYAERDASELVKVMKRLGGVSGSRAVLVVGEAAADVRGAVLEVNARIRAASHAGKDAVLLVYYSGHADASALHLGPTSLALTELKAMVAGSPAAARVLVLDACRSGSLTRVKGVKAAKTFEIDIEDRLKVEGMAIITSSASDEDSHEADRLRGSFFSHHFASGLRGAADRDRDGRVSLDEVYAYTYSQTLRSSGRTLQLQHPTYAYDIKGRGVLVLTNLNAHRRRSGRLRLGHPGLYLVMEGREGGPVAAEIVVGGDGATVALPPRAYFVQRRDPDAYHEYEVTLAAGAEVDLGTIPYKTVAYARLLRKGGGERAAVHGLYATGGVRGEILAGEGPTPQVVVGYTADLAWMTFGARLRFGTASTPATDGLAEAAHHEIAIGLTARRYLDLPWFSISLGILAELVVHLQTFTTPGLARPRTGVGFGFGGLLGLERDLTDALTLRVEGGPMTQVFSRIVTSQGAAKTTTLATPITWWVHAGLAYRF